MKEIFNDADRDLLEGRNREAEQQTGTQIVMAVIKRSDNYPEIPWKAFALGASVTGLIVLLLDLFFPAWINGTTIILFVLAILLAGAFLSIATVLLHGFARWFLAGSRRETEPLQYAHSMFLARELFATEGRRGVLLLLSLFERQVVILPDTGIRDRLGDDIIAKIISEMKPHLKKGNLREAMEAGLGGLVIALSPPGSEMPDKNEFSDEIIQEDGV